MTQRVGTPTSRVSRCAGNEPPRLTVSPHSPFFSYVYHSVLYYPATSSIYRCWGRPGESGKCFSHRSGPCHGCLPHVGYLLSGHAFDAVSQSCSICSWVIIRVHHARLSHREPATTVSRDWASAVATDQDLRPQALSCGCLPRVRRLSIISYLAMRSTHSARPAVRFSSCYLCAPRAVITL